jgi:hypothetical protein
VKLDDETIAELTVMSGFVRRRPRRADHRDQQADRGLLTQIQATVTPSSRATATGSAPMVAGWSTTSQPSRPDSAHWNASSDHG